MSRLQNKRKFYQGITKKRSNFVERSKKTPSNIVKGLLKSTNYIKTSRKTTKFIKQSRKKKYFLQRIAKNPWFSTDHCKKSQFHQKIVVEKTQNSRNNPNKLLWNQMKIQIANNHSYRLNIKIFLFPREWSGFSTKLPRFRLIILLQLNRNFNCVQLLWLLLFCDSLRVLTKAMEIVESLLLIIFKLFLMFFLCMSVCMSATKYFKNT